MLCLLDQCVPVHAHAEAIDVANQLLDEVGDQLRSLIQGKFLLSVVQEFKATDLRNSRSVSRGGPSVSVSLKSPPIVKPSVA